MSRRVTKNQEEDNESDEEFWNQEAFQEVRCCWTVKPTCELSFCSAIGVR